MRTLILALVALAAAFAGILYFGLRGLDITTHHETAEDWL